MTQETTEQRRRVRVLRAPIDVLTWDEAIGRISNWAAARDSRYICITNAHSVVTGSQDFSFRKVLKGADMVTPDGASVAWMLRRLGVKGQKRINGPDLMWRYCEAAATRGEGVYLYGGSPRTLETLQTVLTEKIPGLLISGAFSPPFRALTPEEDEAVVQAINESGAGTVWVGLGCPKQEQWMAAHRGRIAAVMIGVGAAFDYHAGTIKRAPMWMQNHGLEWLHRLSSEPRRLWRRYFLTNSQFIVGALRQLVGGK